MGDIMASVNRTWIAGAILVSALIGLGAGTVIAAVVIDPDIEPQSWQFKQPKVLVRSTDDRPERSVRILNVLLTAEQASTYEGLMNPKVADSDQIEYLKEFRDKLIRDGASPTSAIVLRVNDRITQLGGTP